MFGNVDRYKRAFLAQKVVSEIQWNVSTELPMLLRLENCQKSVSLFFQQLSSVI